MILSEIFGSRSVEKTRMVSFDRCQLRLIAARWVAVVALASCKVEIPQGIFSCRVASDCPHGLVCRADGRCWSTADLPSAEDASIRVDAAEHAPDASESPDAADPT